MALALLHDPGLSPEATAAGCVDAEKQVPDVAAALEGPRWILIEQFADYFNASEPVKPIPSHRALALFRGRNQGVLRLSVMLPEEASRPEGVRNPSAASQPAWASRIGSGPERPG